MKINYRWCVIEHRIGSKIYSEITGALYKVIYKKKSKKSKVSMQNNELLEGRGKKGRERERENEDQTRLRE